MSIRYEGAYAKSVGFDALTGGENIGEDRITDGKFAIAMWYDECFYVEGTRDELIEFFERGLATAQALGNPTKLAERRIRDLARGDRWRWSGDDSFSELTEEPERDPEDADYVLLDGESEDGDAVVQVLEEVR